MKIAISGKGGVGKSTLAAALTLMMAKQGKRVLAVDADPDANLAAALGIPEEKQKEIIPISEQIALIEERTGAKVKQYGQMFKINPEVSDIAENYATMHNGIALLVLGAIEQGGSGCACPESVLLRALVTDLVLFKDDALVLDMEAGVEHLGRATARGVDTMIVVVEPGKRSIDSAFRVQRMAQEIGLKNIRFVANKVTSEEDKNYLIESLPNHEFLGFIPYSESIRKADRDGLSALEYVDAEMQSVFQELYEKILTN